MGAWYFDYPQLRAGDDIDLGGGRFTFDCFVFFKALAMKDSIFLFTVLTWKGTRYTETRFPRFVLSQKGPTAAQIKHLGGGRPTVDLCILF